MKMDSTILHSLASKSPPSTTPLFLQPASSPPSQPPCTHLFFPRHLPRLPKLHCTNSSTDNSSTTSGNDTPPPPPPPAEPIQIRFKRGSRRRRQLQEDGFGVQGQNMKTNKAAIEQPVPKKWEEMSMTEKALDLAKNMNSVWALLASFALIRTTLYNYLPEKLRLYISARFEEWTRRFNTDETMVFKDYQSSKMNQLFQAANLYLGESLPTISIPRVTVEKTENVRNLTFSMEKNTEMIDVYENIPMKWKYFSDYSQGMSKHEISWYELSFHKEYKSLVTNCYLPYILERANKIKERNRVVQLHTAARDFWTPKPVIIQHPMTFETLAMDGNLKKELVEDLDRFMNSKEYYQQIGKVWKRGYLLYGPPGTGKSSLIAAMANHLNFDIYNLNLSAVSSDFVLQNLLLSTANRSILVIEDIDCSIKLQNRESGIELPIKYQQQNKLLPKVKVSPAEVAGELMKTRDPKASTEGLIKHLEEKLIADGNSEVSPKHHSSLSQTSNCQVHKSSISLPLACDGASMDNVKSPGPKPDVSVKSKLTADGEGDNNFEKTDLVRDRSSRHNILQVIEDMEKELLSYKEAIIALQKKSCGTLNKLAGIKATI